MRARAASRRRGAALLLALAGLALLAALGAAPAAADGCPNEARRAEQGAPALPECRAYELVTPGQAVSLDSDPARTSTAGDALTYFTKHPAPGALSGGFIYLARRGPAGWTVEPAGIANAGGAQFGGGCEQDVFFSPDLRRNILELGWFESAEATRCKRPLPVVPGEPEPYRNVLLHDVSTGSYALVNQTPAGVPPANAAFQDASDDFGLLVFAEAARLTPDAPGGVAYYAWSGGAIRPLTVLPDGTVAAGELAEATARPGTWRTGFAPVTGALSASGDRAFFYAGNGLYVRENPGRPQSQLLGGICTEPELACTTQVDASQGPGASGGGNFWRASEDGSTVFFTADSRLTADSTAVAGKPDLYRYEVETGTLADLTVSPAEPADVQGVSGIAADGSRVFFAANGVLAPGAAPGNCPGAGETVGQCSLYALDAGGTDLVARLSREERQVWNDSESTDQRDKGPLLASVSPNGRYLAFPSRRSLTGYDNLIPGEFPQLANEIFLYDAARSDLSCVSCPPGPETTPEQELQTVGNYGRGTETASWRTNALLDDGSLFFNTRDALVPADGDGFEDGYRWRDGALELVSPGPSSAAVRFLDATADGSDVFFRTAQPLLARDTDQGNFNVYDARIGGGFPEPPPPAPACEGEACRLPATAPPPPLAPARAAQPKPRPCRKAKQKKRRCHRHGAKRAKQRRGSVHAKRGGSQR